MIIRQDAGMIWERYCYLQAIIPNWKECINVLGSELRLLLGLGCWKGKQNSRLGPIWALTFLGKVFDDMRPDEILGCLLSSMQNSQPILALLALILPDFLFPHLFISPGDLNVDLLDPSEEYKQICVECQKLMDKRIFFTALRQLEVDRSASRLRLFGECFPNWRNHA